MNDRIKIPVKAGKQDKQSTEDIELYRANRAFDFRNTGTEKVSPEQKASPVKMDSFIKLQKRIGSRFHSDVHGGRRDRVTEGEQKRNPSEQKK